MREYRSFPGIWVNSSPAVRVPSSAAGKSGGEGTMKMQGLHMPWHKKG